MLYDEGTRNHMLQEEKSSRVAPGLLVPCSPLFGGCLLVDSRMEMLLILINALFYTSESSFKKMTKVQNIAWSSVKSGASLSLIASWKCSKDACSR